VDLTTRRVVKLTHQVAAPDRSGVLFRIAVLSGAARNANWGGELRSLPLPLLLFPSSSPPLLTGVRGYNPGFFWKLKVLVGEF